MVRANRLLEAALADCGLGDAVANERPEISSIAVRFAAVGCRTMTIDAHLAGHSAEAEGA